MGLDEAPDDETDADQQHEDVEEEHGPAVADLDDAFVGAGVVPHPLKGLLGILEAGRVDEPDDLLSVDGHGKGLTLDGFTRRGADADAVVLGQGGDHRRFAFVGMADDGEFGDGIG